MKQLQDWKMWFANNRNFVCQNFPFKEQMAKIGISDPELNLVIGRRELAMALSFRHPDNLPRGMVATSYDRLEYGISSPGIDLLKPLKVCSYKADKIEVISELNMNISYSIEVKNLRRR